MSKFNKKINEIYYGILGEAGEQPGLDQTGGPQQDPNAPAPAPAPAAAPAPAPEEPQPMTPEGKKFLVELALKCLAVNPDTISQADKAIFDTHVTTSNADEVEKRIKDIVEGL